MANQWYRQRHSENPLRSDSRRNHLNQRKSFATCGLFVVVLATAIGGGPSSLPAAEPAALAEQRTSEGIAALATAAEQSGDPRKGAVLFHTQHLTCTKCPAAGTGPSPLGPNLAEVRTVEKGSPGATQPAKGATPSLVEHLVESLLEPSKTIRPEYRPVTILTEEGQSVSGIVVSESPEAIVLRDAADPGREMTIPRTDIASRTFPRPWATNSLGTCPQPTVARQGPHPWHGACHPVAGTPSPASRLATRSSSR